MGIRAWQATGILDKVSIYSFTSLQIGAELVEQPKRGDFLLVTDARRNSWNAIERKSGEIGEVKLISNESLEAFSGRIYTLTNFPSWPSQQNRSPNSFICLKTFSANLDLPGF